MLPKPYHKQIPDSTALPRAVRTMYDMSRREFARGNEGEGIFFMQLAQDLQKIAAHGSPRGTSLWRALAAQHPRLFRRRPGDEEHAAATERCLTRSICEIREIAQSTVKGDAA